MNGCQDARKVDVDLMVNMVCPSLLMLSLSNLSCRCNGLLGEDATSIAFLFRFLVFTRCCLRGSLVGLLRFLLCGFGSQFCLLLLSRQSLLVFFRLLLGLHCCLGFLFLLLFRYSKVSNLTRPSSSSNSTPLSCFSFIICAVFSLSRCISEPLLLLPDFCTLVSSALATT